MDRVTEQLRAAMPFGGFLGLEVVSASAEEVRARLAWAEKLCTAGGILHGGALMGVADSTGGFCAFLNLPADATGTATIESKTNFFAPVREGWIEAVSRPLHVARRRSSSTRTSSTPAGAGSPGPRRHRQSSGSRPAPECGLARVRA
jgi:1,4-dihydroxy-2-naphthoyl-CoA hydrolase